MVDLQIIHWISKLLWKILTIFKYTFTSLGFRNKYATVILYVFLVNIFHIATNHATYIPDAKIIGKVMNHKE